jgi:hypothetical protein
LRRWLGICRTGDVSGQVARPIAYRALNWNIQLMARAKAEGAAVSSTAADSALWVVFAAGGGLAGIDA